MKKQIEKPNFEIEKSGERKWHSGDKVIVMGPRDRRRTSEGEGLVKENGDKETIMEGDSG